MLTKQELLDEAQKQKRALAVIGVWRNWLFVLTTLALVLGLWGLQHAFALGIAALILAAVCFTLLLLVNLSIRNGHRNVERILDSLKS